MAYFFLIDEGSIDKENSIWERKSKIRFLYESMDPGKYAILFGQS
jgi:hypothetical protein